MKNLLLTRDLSVVDDRICRPPTVRPADLGDLLATVAERLEPEGVLMLSGPWADYVRPYADQGGPVGDARELRAGDWSAKVVQDDTWIRWRHDGSAPHSIWTCEVDAVPVAGKDSPLIAEDPVVTAAHMHLWRETTGQPWVGTPGMTGNALLIDGWGTMSPKAAEPKWSSTGIWDVTSPRPTWPFGEIEQPYTSGKWSCEHTGPEHGYDLNRAYLSAYQVAELAVDELQHVKAPEFTPRAAGVWRVELSLWRYDHLLPDPAGYAPALEDGTRWLTTPTLHLLQQLTDRGDYDGFTIREAWIAPARRVTRKWAELINDVATAAREPLATAAKQVYKQTYGMWARGGRVRRPDWRAAIIATARCNLWRKMDAAYRGSHSTLDWDVNSPRLVRVETDCLFYEAHHQPIGRPPVTDWEGIGAAAGFKLDPSGIALGAFKPYVPKGDR